MTDQPFFKIERIDIDIDNQNSAKIYNMDILHNYKFNINEKHQIFIAIKKAILCTNLSIRWKSNNIKTFLSFINLICTLIGGILLTFCKSENTNKYLRKTLFANILIVPLWVLGYYFYFKLSDELENIQYNLVSYILKVQGLLNNSFNYNINKHFAILVSRKSNEVIHKKEFEKEIFINYAVSVNIEPSIEDVIYSKLIPANDMLVIKDIFNFTNSELNNKISVLLKSSILPSALICLNFYYRHKDQYLFWFKFLVLIMILIAFIAFIEKEAIKLFKGKFIDFLDDYNKKSIENGKYVYKHRTLLIILDLNERGKNCSNIQLKNYVEDIIFNKKVV